MIEVDKKDLAKKKKKKATTLILKLQKNSAKIFQRVKK